MRRVLPFLKKARPAPIARPSSALAPAIVAKFRLCNRCDSLQFKTRFPRDDVLAARCCGRSTERYQRLGFPARLGKGQGAKEIGHDLARERPKFGRNLLRKRDKIWHGLERE